MNDIEASLQEFPLISLSSGEFLLTQGEKTDCLYFLHKGAVKILKDGYEVAKRTDNGAVLGEMSIMLDIEHSVSVQCVQDSKFYCIEQPRKFLEKHPNVIWNIAQILSLRLYNLTQYLVDVKSQYEGHDPLNVVDEVLEALLNAQQSKVLKRGESNRDTPDY
ncbi:Crp/Fnr family transcriptional regulator [Methyloprofundus sp.]|uniref:Crp/Fnr family transcriptional regulator n=1 Tax=Methyloprofundus sp. TaxID=2020875 RepID=UPI003D104688